jgi:hypothetical protein
MLGLGFLYTDDISILLVHPFKKTFGGCRPNAVGIQRNNSHRYQAPGVLLELRVSITFCILIADREWAARNEPARNGFCNAGI